MSATRTPAQQQASRENGKKSRGPITDEGKARSRRNAVRHGLSDGQAAVLPASLQTEVERRVTAFGMQFRPRDDYERSLVRTAAVACARLEQLAAAEVSLAAARVRRAAHDHDAARDAEVARAVAQLATDPSAALQALLRTAEGCDWLSDAWDLLAESFEASGQFDAATRQQAARLLGHSAADPSALDRALRRLCALCTALDEGDPEAAGELLEFLQTRRDQLAQRGDSLWERLDGPDRAEAARRALFDGGPECQRLMRYMAAAERMRRRALLELAEERVRRPLEPRIRPSAPPAAAAAPNEPSVSQPKPQQQPTEKTLDTNVAAVGQLNARPPQVSYVPIAMTPHRSPSEVLQTAHRPTR